MGPQARDLLCQIGFEPSSKCNFLTKRVWYFLPEFATGHRLVVSDGGEITLRFIHLQSTIIANFQFCNSYCVFYFILYNVSTSKQTVQCSCSYIPHLSVKGPSLLADQCSGSRGVMTDTGWRRNTSWNSNTSRSLKTCWRRWRRICTRGHWQLWIERRNLAVSYLGEATGPMSTLSVVQCQHGWRDDDGAIWCMCWY